MATRDLTKMFLEKRSAAVKRRHVVAGGAGGGNGDYQKLSANGAIADELLLEEGGIQMSSMNKTMMNGATSTTNTTTKQQSLLSSSEMTIGTNNSNNTTNHVLLSNRPQWCNDVDKIQNYLSDIQRQMDKLQNLHSTRVGSVFGKDLDDMEHQIEDLTKDLTDMFRQVERLLQKIGTSTKIKGGQDAILGSNVQRSLAKQLQELSVAFRQSQRKYLTEVQNQKGMYNGGGGGGGGVGGSGSGVDSKFGIDFAGGGDSNNDSGNGHGNDNNDYFNTQQLTVVDDLTQAVQTRDEEIIQIAKSIEELGAIFKELAVLVIDQGTVLDRIDYNMEAVVEHTKTGVQQLERANNAQKSARPLKCIICLSSLVFVLMLILILKHHRFHLFF